MNRPDWQVSAWQSRAWYLTVCVAGLAVFAIVFAMTGEPALALLAGFGTSLLMLLFARVQEQETPDGRP
ncbi:MAG TPA: hypothetical protein VG501_10915 [Rhizomicrobium sp.]|nr:hypothetical protein [Rhizomicrobium sp.]